MTIWSKRDAARGFTLIELMMIVMMVGILATLGGYSVRRYIYAAKTAEAKNSVGQMAKDAKTAFERESMAAAILAVGTGSQLATNLCTSTSRRVPANATDVQGKKYQSSNAEWAVDASTPGKGFSCLKFQLTDPQQYMYDYVGTTGASGVFTAIASGDLDGNGVMSTFSIAGAVTTGSVYVSPSILEVSPEE
jgi:type IV pilus assembly protein PilA